jgi:hypothetical protein
MSTVRDVIARLEKLKAKLEDPRPFYLRHGRSWLELSRRIVQDTLNVSQPPGIEPEQWQEQVMHVAARVAILFSEDEDGTGFVLALPPRLMPDPFDNPEHFSIGNISIDDVRRWVEAGHAKVSTDEPGKNLTEIDAGKTDLQIAWRVMYALKLQKPGWERLLGALREFLGLEAETIAETLYPEILKAWLDYFSVRGADSWRAYVHELVESF